jgi:hypothetical protein
MKRKLKVKEKVMIQTKRSKQNGQSKKEEAQKRWSKFAVLSRQLQARDSLLIPKVAYEEKS